MDLLGDLGTADQLTSARAENAVLTKKVKELTERVKVLHLENQQLLAEVELYRKEAALPNFSNMALGAVEESSKSNNAAMQMDDFVKSGNGVYANENVVTLCHIHGAANLLCCDLDPTDTLVAVGGASKSVALVPWGDALAPGEGISEKVVQNASRLECGAPVICVAFSQTMQPSSLLLLAAGCMDGSLHVASIIQGRFETVPVQPPKHAKYIKCCAWSPTQPSLLASASADGTVMFTSTCETTSEVVQTLHLPGAVESICFSNDNMLYCYARGTPYLSCFNVTNGYEMTKLNLNGVNGGFQDHVSFAVMDIKLSPNGTYLALATDTSRNIIMDVKTGQQVRNLYGHYNDGFSQPKVAWSANSCYLYGNTQDANVICVWDIASSQIVEKLEGHASVIRDLKSSSAQSDTLISVSFDKQTKVWCSNAM